MIGREILTMYGTKPITWKQIEHRNYTYIYQCYEKHGIFFLCIFLNFLYVHLIIYDEVLEHSDHQL